jgi:molybdopterin molybdotransferase
LHFISVEEASTILENLEINTKVESIDLDQAYGRYLAEDICADRDFPPFDRVSMDGIAILFSAFQSGQRSFNLEATHFAGSEKIRLHDPQKCIEIMTGAILPDGTDTVIRYEDLKKTENGFLVNAEIKPYQNIHKKGIDKKKSDVLVPKNRLLQSPELAVAATVGLSKIKVIQELKIAIVSTGDELVGIDQVPLEHQIRRSNATAIKELLQPFSKNVSSYHIKDEENQLLLDLKEIIAASDLIIMSGGVSMGQKDLVPKVLEKLELETLFYKVKQKPGKPLLVMKKDAKWVFALPGNPSSTIVCTVRYILPFLKRMYTQQEPKLIQVQLAESLKIEGQLTHFLQVRLNIKEGIITASTIINHGSGDFANLVQAQGFIELKPKTEGYMAGESVPFYSLRNDRFDAD